MPQWLPHPGTKIPCHPEEKVKIRTLSGWVSPKYEYAADINWGLSGISDYKIQRKRKSPWVACWGITIPVPDNALVLVQMIDGQQYRVPAKIVDWPNALAYKIIKEIKK